MKNHLFLGLIITSAFLSNCNSKDDNDFVEESTAKKTLLSKVTTVYYDNPNNPETTVSTLSYNDNGQITGSESAGRTSTFEYDASGKPIKTNYYKADKTLEYYAAYTYNGEQLTSTKAIYTNPAFNRTISYSYDSTGKLSKTSLCQSENCTNPSTNSYNYAGDNISVETTVSAGTINYSYKTESSYDDKLNPYNNVNKYLRIMMGGAYALSKNNFSSAKNFYKDSDGSWVQNGNITYTAQYNDANFPVQVVGKDANGNNYVQYHYEYVTR